MKKIITILLLGLLALNGCTAFPWDWPWYDVCGEYAPNGPRGRTKTEEKMKESDKKWKNAYIVVWTWKNRWFPMVEIQKGETISK